MSVGAASFDRAGSGTTQAHPGNPSLDLRRRSASAGDAALVGRDDAVTGAFLIGARPKELALRFGLTEARVSQILSRSPAIRRATDKERARRKRDEASRVNREIDEVLAEYRCGFSAGEIAERRGVGRSAITARLYVHPDYRPRRGGNHLGLSLRVPAWVPERHIDRWRRLAGVNGTAVADECLRRMLVWEAR